jgi:hypothetical protein
MASAAGMAKARALGAKKVAVALVEPKAEDEETRSIPTLYERLKCVIGKAKGLPPDLALNHDHYLHGQPKR